MKNINVFGIIVVSVLIVSFMPACGNPTDSPGTPTVSSVTVSPSTPVVEKGGTIAFSAAVEGTNNPDKTVTWSLDAPGKNAETLISAAGVLTVAAAEDLTSLTVRATSTVDDTKSGTAAVTVTKESEESLWDTWSDSAANSTIAISVDPDGVCNVTIGGTADRDAWKTSARYKYTSKANTFYSYEFEAWTDGGNRLLDVQYGGGLSGSGPWETRDQLITGERKTYKFTEKTVHGGPNLLEFRGADQLGTFHVKVLSIVPVVDEGIIPNKWVGTYEAGGDTGTIFADGRLSWTGWYGIPDGSRTGATITEGGTVSGGGFTGEWVYLTVNGRDEGIIIHIEPANELGWNYIVGAGSYGSNGLSDLLSIISKAGVTLSPYPRTYGYPSDYYFMGGK